MLLRLLHEAAETDRKKLVVAIALSGMANAAVIELAQQGARTAAHPSLRLLLLFLLTCAMFGFSFRYSIRAVSEIFEAAIYKIRIRVADKLRKADLQSLEQLGTSTIFERLTQETSLISQVASPIAVGLQSVTMLAFMALYIWHLSAVALLLSVLLFGGGWIVMRSSRLQSKELMRQTADMQVNLFDRLTDILKGIKEVRFHTARSEELYQDFVSIAASLRTATVKTNVYAESRFIFFQLNLFALLAVIIFVMPQHVPITIQQLSSLISALLFVFGAIGGMFWGLNQYDFANLAAENIYKLERSLEKLASTSNVAGTASHQRCFRELRAEQVEYRYHTIEGQEAFVLGPLSLTIQAGEILFIVGGNGSGKSTLLKLLTGLYTPTAGSLYLDDVLLNVDTIQRYRELIAAIFGDFHLFKKLYGLPDVCEEDVQRLLEQLGIAKKTTYANGGMSTLDLSTGQRKRLAMVIALLEDRPIYVFDEWAADQDPEFRRYYYEELLPGLKQRGKTVIAVSHDDRYFRCADRILKMEYGQFHSIAAPRGSSGTSEPPPNQEQS